MLSTLDTAELKDIPEILTMMEEFYAIDQYPFDAEITRSNLNDFINNSDLGRFFLIRYESETAGYIVLTFGYSFEYQGRDAFIDEFFLKYAFRGRGIGTKTLKLIEQESAKLGVKAIHLEVESRNTKANQLYIRQGFSGNNRSLLTKKIELNSYLV